MDTTGVSVVCLSIQTISSTKTPLKRGKVGSNFRIREKQKEFECVPLLSGVFVDEIVCIDRHTTHTFALMKK